MSPTVPLMPIEAQLQSALALSLVEAIIAIQKPEAMYTQTLLQEEEGFDFLLSADQEEEKENSGRYGDTSKTTGGYCYVLDSKGNFVDKTPR